MASTSHHAGAVRSAMAFPAAIRSIQHQTKPHVPLAAWPVAAPLEQFQDWSAHGRAGFFHGFTNHRCGASAPRTTNSRSDARPPSRRLRKRALLTLLPGGARTLFTRSLGPCPGADQFAQAAGLNPVARQSLTHQNLVHDVSDASHTVIPLHRLVTKSP